MTVMFDSESAARIAETVLRVESMYGNGGSKRRRSVVGSGGRRILRGKLDATLNPGGSAMVSIWEFDGTDSDTGEHIEVHDWLLQANQTIEAGRKVFIVRLDNRWYVIAAECPTPS